MNEKILVTSKLPKRERDDRVDQGPCVFVSTGRPVGMSVDSYIARYGTEAEKSELVKAIETRRAKLPRWIYLVCPSCNWKMKTPFGDSDIEKRERPRYCLACNRQGYTDGAIMREMTKAEIKKFEADAVQKEKLVIERMFKANFFAHNQSRQAQGLPVMTEDEYREYQKRAWLAQQGKR